MGNNLTKNFDTSEFACKCGCGFGQDEQDISSNLITQLQSLRDLLNKPIRVVSGCRCKKYNQRCGGVESSQHILGNAADIQVDGMTPKQLKAFILKNCPYFKAAGGIGIYNTFVHVDIRRRLARWSGETANV